MEAKEKITEIKNRLVDSVERWGGSLIDTLGEQHPKISPLKLYIKRGLHNSLSRYDAEIERAIDNVMLFVGDERGEYQVSEVWDDLLGILGEMDEMDISLGVVDATIGKGNIAIHLPRNPIIGMFFGDVGTVRITGEDLRELKNIFING